MTADEWSLIKREVEYENSWYCGGYNRVRQPDGSEKNYYWAELSDAVVVVARKKDEIIMIDQYRPTIQKQCLELPAGLVEDDESYEQAGHRELIEETGYDADRVELIESFWCTTGVLRHRRGIVFAGELTEVDRDTGKNEFIDVRFIPIDEVMEIARRDPANDATIESILLAKHDGYI